jgi:hypothetical protein
MILIFSTIYEILMRFSITAILKMSRQNYTPPVSYPFSHTPIKKE